MGEATRDRKAGQLSRRKALYLGGGAATAAGALPLWGVFRQPDKGAQRLRPVSNGVLDLPPGFDCRVLQQSGETMSDGYRVPSRPDGMACFVGADSKLILMRNHEIGASVGGGAYPADHPPPSQTYAEGYFGGVTRVVIDPSDGSVASSNLVLTGTARNCAGGVSPWGWLSCEENVDPGHGYVFLCATDAKSVQTPRRIASYGRFRHEAAVVEPERHVAYLTEDRGDSCFYRFVPDDPERPFEGRLQALRVRESPNLELGDGLEIGDRLRVEWVDVAEPDPADDTVRFQAHEQGAAIVRRGEGLWLHGGQVYFCATSGGPVHSGQVFRYSMSDETLELVAQSEGPHMLDMPDNITVAPWGEIFVVEDGIGRPFIRRIDRSGQVTSFARNALSGSELAGACFSPDGSTLFVNMQEDGLTLAITGPFEDAAS